MEKGKLAKHLRVLARVYKKQLANETWAQVLDVFGYFNPEALRTDEQKFNHLNTFYREARYPNIAEFVEHVRFAEKEHGTAVSFNFSMRRRLSPGKSPDFTAENAMLFFNTPDILIGSRNGNTGAAIWLKNFSEKMPGLPSEFVQVMDKIFGEAIKFTGRPSHTITLGEMASMALGRGEKPKPSRVTKH